ncbi:MAG: dephospho-CoA kinase [Gemmataceae bacterium]
MSPRSRKPVIGLVGGIGSGKSLVAQLLARRGGFPISADPIAHEALRDPGIRTKVVARFGAEVLGPDGEIVRKKLAGPVFADDSLRRELESWVFPWVECRVTEQVAQAEADAGVQFVILDAAVMLEAGWNNVCDGLIYVDAPREVRLARVASRGWSPEQVAAREQAQLPLAEKARRADAAIDNGGSAEQTARQIDELLTNWNLRSPEAVRGLEP